MSQVWGYSDLRQQPVSVTTTAGGGSSLAPGLNLLTLSYAYCPGGSASCASNNGNVLSAGMNASAAGTSSAFSFTQNFGYDGVNRLVTASETGGASQEWMQPFVYDWFGNRALLAGTGVYIPYTGFTPQVTTNSAAAVAQLYSNNQWTAAGYDSAGNQKAVNGVAYTYDAENRLSTVASATVPLVQFGYDGEGRRVQKTVTTNSGTDTVVYAYAASGELLAEYGSAVQQGGTQYVVADALGSTRLVTTSAGVPVERRDYAPFGEELVQGVGARDAFFGGGSYPTVGSTQTPVEFTGKKRDSETGLDYFGARYFSGAQGRFTSVDPAFESEILELPQTWNRYSYVYNRPLFATDPDGRCPPCVGAIVGGVVEGAWNLGSQLYQNGGDLNHVSWREVGANAAGGAVAGAIAGATGGGSLLADALVGAGSNAVGGIVTRIGKGDDASEAFAPVDIGKDAVSGFVGGGAGHLAADFVHVHEEPELPGSRSHAVGRRKLLKYNAAQVERTRAVQRQVAIGTVTGSPPTHAVLDGLINNFWNIYNFVTQPSQSSVQPKKDYATDITITYK